MEKSHKQKHYCFKVPLLHFLALNCIHAAPIIFKISGRLSFSYQGEEMSSKGNSMLRLSAGVTASSSPEVTTEEENTSNTNTRELSSTFEDLTTDGVSLTEEGTSIDSDSSSSVTATWTRTSDSTITTPQANSTTTTTATTTTTTTQPEENNDDNLAAILGGIFIPLALIFLAILIYVYLKWKRSSVPMTTAARKRRKLSLHPISVLEFNSQFHFRLREGEIQEEFELLQEHSAQLYDTKPRTIGQDEVNKPKNRFVDIVPYDDTLVKLRGPAQSDYINASWIKGTSNDVYVATQGPKRNTVVDFWNMVIDEQISIIVCLTNIVEAGRMKCFQYWPNANEMLHFDELTLLTAKETESEGGDCVIREIEVSRESDDDEASEETQIVKQIHLTSWPDHGVPTSPVPLLNLCVSLIESSSREHQNVPILVHCSAGVGRTGTLIAVNTILKEIVEQSSDEVDVTSVVKSLREQRPKMVQTYDQYLFIYACIREFINTKQSGQFNHSETRGVINEGYITGNGEHV